MHAIKITTERIMLRPGELTIDAGLLIQPDDPEADAIRTHIPDVVKVEELPAELQECIATLFSLCDARMMRKQGLTNG